MDISKEKMDPGWIIKIAMKNWISYVNSEFPMLLDRYIYYLSFEKIEINCWQIKNKFIKVTLVFLLSEYLGSIKWGALPAGIYGVKEYK